MGMLGFNVPFFTSCSLFSLSCFPVGYLNVSKTPILIYLVFKYISLYSFLSDCSMYYIIYT